MITWTLILYFSFAHQASAATIDGFKSEDACKVAAEQAKRQIGTLYYSAHACVRVERAQ